VGDLLAIFGTTDYPGRCHCQRFKVAGWIWRDSTQEGRTALLEAQTACGNPDAKPPAGRSPTSTASRPAV
jgi:hypothetical protein